MTIKKTMLETLNCTIEIKKFNTFHGKNLSFKEDIMVAARPLRPIGLFNFLKLNFAEPSIRAEISATLTIFFCATIFTKLKVKRCSLRLP